MCILQQEMWYTNLSVSRRPDWLWSLPRLLSNGYRCLSSAVKPVKREADPLTPSSLEIQFVELDLHFPIRFHAVVFN
jgi:hypothetical protein